MTAMPALDRRSDYVSAVAVELTDLEPDDRAELIEELDDHIAALLEDRPHADLAVELGTPRAYAAELRAAAGLAGAGTRPGSFWRQTTDRVAALPERVPEGLRPWLAGLRPTWWVLRAYLVVAGLFHWLHQTWANSGIGVLIPAPGGSAVIGVLVVLAAAAASVRIATWDALTPGSRRWTSVVLAVLALVAVVGLWGPVHQGYRSEGYVSTEYVDNCPIELDNLYAYDASGKPLSGVRLYDQYGSPFDLSVFGCNISGQFAPGGEANVYPWPDAMDQPAAPTGPPSTLAPLPGATVSSAAPSTTPSTTPAAPSATP
jgi:hypothetical protein